MTYLCLPWSLAWIVSHAGKHQQRTHGSRASPPCERPTRATGGGVIAGHGPGSKSRTPKKITAPIRCSSVTEMTRSRLRPAVIASSAAAHNPSTAPTPTASGLWYFAARFAVAI